MTPAHSRWFAGNVPSRMTRLNNAEKSLELFIIFMHKTSKRRILQKAVLLPSSLSWPDTDTDVLLLARKDRIPQKPEIGQVRLKKAVRKFQILKNSIHVL